MLIDCTQIMGEEQKSRDKEVKGENGRLFSLIAICGTADTGAILSASYARA